MGFASRKMLSNLRIVSGPNLAVKVLFEIRRKRDFWLSDQLHMTPNLPSLEITILLQKHTLDPKPKNHVPGPPRPV